MADPEVIIPDEILPPGSEGARPGRTRGAGGVRDTRGLVSALIAHWLDEAIKIPGLNIRLGLDPLLAFIPGLGDAAATGVGATILLAAVRHRAPVGMLGRMAGNMAINALLDAVPFAGPALSIWFRSNSRNNVLLQRHLAGQPPGPASPQSKILFAVVILFVLGIAITNMILFYFLVKEIGRIFG